MTSETAPNESKMLLQPFNSSKSSSNSIRDLNCPSDHQSMSQEKIVLKIKGNKISNGQHYNLPETLRINQKNLHA